MRTPQAANRPHWRNSLEAFFSQQIPNGTHYLLNHPAEWDTAILQSPHRFILLMLDDEDFGSPKIPHFYLIDTQFNSKYSLLINYHAPELNLDSTPNICVQTIKLLNAKINPKINPKINIEINTALATSCLILAYALHGCLQHQQPYLIQRLNQQLLDQPIQALLLAQALEHSPTSIISTDNTRCAQRLFFLHMNEKRQENALTQLKHKPLDLLSLFNFEHVESQKILQAYLNKNITHRPCLDNYVNTYLHTREAVTPLLDLWQRITNAPYALSWLYQIWQEFYAKYPQNWLMLSHPYALPVDGQLAHTEEDLQWIMLPKQRSIRDFYFYLLCQDYPRWDQHAQAQFRVLAIYALHQQAHYQLTLSYVLSYFLNYSVDDTVSVLYDNLNNLEARTIAYGIAIHCLHTQQDLVFILNKMRDFPQEDLESILESLRSHPDAETIHKTIHKTIHNTKQTLSKKISIIFFKHLIFFNQSYNTQSHNPHRAEWLINHLKDQTKHPSLLNSLLENLLTHGVPDDRYISGVLNILYYCAKRWMQDNQGLENENTHIYQYLIIKFFHHVDQAEYVQNSWQLHDWIKKLDNDFPYLRARLPASQSLNKNRLFKSSKSSTTALDKKKFHISSEITRIQNPNKNPDEATSSASPAH